MRAASAHATYADFFDQMHRIVLTRVSYSSTSIFININPFRTAVPFGDKTT